MRIKKAASLLFLVSLLHSQLLLCRADLNILQVQSPDPNMSFESIGFIGIGSE